MFTESYNFMVVQSALDSVFAVGKCKSESVYIKSDYDYAEYNRRRIEKYEREDKRREFINKLLGFAMVACIIALFFIK